MGRESERDILESWHRGREITEGKAPTDYETGNALPATGPGSKFHVLSEAEKQRAAERKAKTQQKGLFSGLKGPRGP